MEHILLNVSTINIETKDSNGKNKYFLSLYKLYLEKNKENIKRKDIIYDEDMKIYIKKFSYQEFITEKQGEGLGTFSDRISIVKDILIGVSRYFQGTKMRFIIDPNKKLIEYMLNEICNKHFFEVHNEILTYKFEDLVYNEKEDIYTAKHLISIK